MAPLRSLRARIVVCEGRPVEVAVRESARARRLTIKVSTDRPAEIVVPAGTREREIDRALRRHRDWIGRKAEEMARLATRRPRLGLDRRGVVWLQGEQVPIVRSHAARAVARLHGGILVVGGSAADLENAVERWYRREARRLLRQTVAREAARLAVRPGRIAVRDQRTRWGSCTGRGSLSFSWRLLLAPPEILDYVVVHELCHLRELNHSPAFWSLLDAARPGWRSQAAWLAEHGWELGAYRPRLGE